MAKQIHVENRKAKFNYFIENEYEVGIVLTGTEIKSIRAGKVNLSDSFARIENGEVILHNMHISPYEQGNRFNHEPLRNRKLLLHRTEINKLIGKIKESGYSLIPIELYIKQGRCKIKLALAKGKKQYDKRETLREKDSKREVERALKSNQY